MNNHSESRFKTKHEKTLRWFEKVLPEILGMLDQGMDRQQVADTFNARGFWSRHGNVWTYASVTDFLRDAAKHGLLTKAV